MRKDIIAPVDDMGCDQAADLNALPEVYTLSIYYLQNLFKHNINSISIFYSLITYFIF